jgi:hypothetical protein
MTSQTYGVPSAHPRRMTAEQFADSISEITGEWRVSQSGESAVYAREWELKSTPMTRAMGRPIRDQVFTTREDAATTLQALELVNGDTLAILLKRGALRLQGELPAAPQNLFDSRRLNKGSKPLDVDISGAKQLWLFIDDAGCYDPSRTVAGWIDLKADGKLISTLPTLSKQSVGLLTTDKVRHDGSIIAPVGELVLYPIEGLGLKHLTGAVGIDDNARTSDINPNVRFFVFTQKPDLERLLRVSGDPPAPLPKPMRDTNALIDQLFWQALSRKATPREQAVAMKLLAKQGGLEDLIWSLIMHPEFQYVQ